MESGQLIQDVMPALDTRMAEYLSAGHHLKGDAAEAQADFDARLARVLGLSGPLGGQGLEMMVAHDQVVGDGEDGGAEGMVTVAHQRTIRVVDLVALVPGGT